LATNCRFSKGHSISFAVALTIRFPAFDLHTATRK
jgi:hypothetical protein